MGVCGGGGGEREGERKYVMYNKYANIVLAVCTDLSDKEQHRQVGVGKVITSAVLSSLTKIPASHRNIEGS